MLASCSSDTAAFSVPVAGPVLCHCDLPICVWVVYKGEPANIGRVFSRCWQCQGQQCSYFRWADHLNPNVALNYQGTVGHKGAVAWAQASTQSMTGTHYSGVVKDINRAIQGEANSMCNMHEHVHIQQAADNCFEFIVNGGDELYTFVSISRDAVQSCVCSDDAALRAAASKLIKEVFHSINKEHVEGAEAKLR